MRILVEKAERQACENTKSLSTRLEDLSKQSDSLMFLREEIDAIKRAYKGELEHWCHIATYLVLHILKQQQPIIIDSEFDSGKIYEAFLNGELVLYYRKHKIDVLCLKNTMEVFRDIAQLEDEDDTL